MYFTNQDVDSFIDAIGRYQTIIIHRHIRPDPDALGSQLGLKELILYNYPDKNVLVAGSSSKGLAWMGQMDSVKKEDYTNALAIILDTANRPRIDGDYYDQADVILKLDHHLLVDSYGDLEIVYSQASSTSEMITLLSSSLGDKLAMNAKAASLLYAGIVGDTGRFIHDNTTPLTFEMAAFLAKQDISTFQIADHFQTMSVNQAKFQGYILEQIQLLPEGVASVVISREDLKNFDISEEQTNSITNLPGLIDGMKAWAIFIQQESTAPNWRVRLRSKGPAINQIAEQFGGGGHAKASGANAESKEEMDQIIHLLKQAVKDYQANLSEKE
ncbi:DHH family phosphoesterase [Hutsoniella sourekii]|uniref:DHH family phosphoesterase n=1 Tax=Hutsoniella sourekii TaxID=87650 RepID=UPI00048734CC|nr:bifunctional oligoribonuclease/PAP phosphatase NrnA [Hutsoniella sourekii]